MIELQSINGLQNIYNIFKQKISSDNKKLLIFDEIQIIPKWERFIRIIYERDKDINIIITGSNRDLLSSELSSRLAGRSIEYKIFPFNFKEFLLYHKINIKNKNDYLKNKEIIDKLYYKFFKYGGLPEIFSINTEFTKYTYLNGIINKIILDDIIKRFNVKNIQLLEGVLIYILSGIGNITVINRLTNKIEAIKNISINQKTIKDYISYFIKSFTLFDIPKLNWKLSRVFESTKKYYSIDLGIISAKTSNFDNIESKKLENLVFLHLLQKQSPIYFGQDNLNKEIDFITQENNFFNRYQVSKTLTPDNTNREINNLVLCNKYLQKGENFIISEDPSNHITYKNTDIHIKNIVEFLLDI